VAENRVLFCACLVLALPVWIAGADKNFPSLGDAHHSDKSYRLVWQEEFTGTKMGFQGLLNETDRQAIISYLKGLKIQK